VGLTPAAVVIGEEVQADMDDLKAQVLELGVLIDYQNGSVVSRQVIKKEVGNVTVFAFDTGEGLSEHTAPFDALVYVYDGEAEVTIGGKTSTVQAGQMIVMPADLPHSLHAKKRFKMMLVMIRSS
jgi:quercetin dioxygenase-like cupin family protein